jgi:hypothetical protein
MIRQRVFKEDQNMELIAITRAFGIINLIISIGFLYHLRHYEEMARKMVCGPDGFILGGVLPVLVSTPILCLHQDWSFDWGTPLTVASWILLLVGVFRICCVHWWTRIITHYIHVVPILFAVFGLIFGLMLCYAGFIAPMYHLA